jgi:zinc protease
MAVRAGARDDPPGMDGLAHLVEHLAFAGPNSAHVVDLARRGLVFNAGTGWDRTCFTAVGHFSLLEDFVVLLENALGQVACEPATILKEMKTLQHEYTARAVIDTYAALAMRRLWGPILGSKRAVRPGWKNLTNLKRHSHKHVGAFHQKYYRADNAALAIVSPFGPDELAPILQKHFPNTHDGEPLAEPAVVAPPAKRVVPPLVEFRSASVQTWVQVYHYYLPLNRYPLAALALLSDVLGGGVHSFLFRTIRDESRLAYNVSSQMQVFGNCGAVMAQALVHRKAVWTALQILLKQIGALGSHGLTEEAFADAKSRLLQKLEMLEDEWGQLANFMVQEYQGDRSGTVHTPQVYLSQLEALDLREFNQMARNLLHKENRVVVLSGTVHLLSRWRIKRFLKRN